jgi:hypothetical protein
MPTDPDTRRQASETIRSLAEVFAIPGDTPVTITRPDAEPTRMELRELLRRIARRYPRETRPKVNP